MVVNAIRIRNARILGSTPFYDGKEAPKNQHLRGMDTFAMKVTVKCLFPLSLVSILLMEEFGP